MLIALDRVLLRYIHLISKSDVILQIGGVAGSWGRLSEIPTAWGFHTEQRPFQFGPVPYPSWFLKDSLPSFSFFSNISILPFSAGFFLLTMSQKTKISRTCSQEGRVDSYIWQTALFSGAKTQSAIRFWGETQSCFGILGRVWHDQFTWPSCGILVGFPLTEVGQGYQEYILAVCPTFWVSETHTK